MENALPPILLGLNLPAIVDLRAGPYFEIGASARDPDGQGLAVVEVYLDREFAYRTPQKMGYARGYTDKLTVGFTSWDEASMPTTRSALVWMSDASASGSYRVLKVAVTDMAGNRTVYAASDLQAMGLDTTLEVKGGNTDTTAPVLLDLAMPASVEIKGAATTPGLQLRVQDNAQGAGVHEVIVQFDRELAFSVGSGKELVLRPPDLTRDGQPIDLGNLAYPLSARTAPGTYHIEGVTVVDFAGNRSSYTRAQLDALGMDTALTVANSAVQTATAAQSFGQEHLLVDVTSTAWNPAAPNSFRLVFGYRADLMRFEAATLAAQPGVSLSASVSGDPGEWVQLTVTGTGLTAAQAMAGIRIALRPLDEVQSGWQLSEFSVNGQDQIAGVETPHGAFVHGIDRAVIDFAREGATITRTGAGFEVLSASGQSLVLADVERLAFGDDYLALDTDGVAGQAYRLYQAAVDRKPDAAGLGYWIHQMEHGASLREVAAAFMAGSEFRTLYGSALSDAGFITALYDNVLHRAPDEAGLAWWRDAFAAGLTREEALVYFSESVENVAQVAPAIVNGIDYTLW
jgi:hypothetical protein